MLYEYINDNTGKIVEVDFPMNEDHPSEIEVDGKMYRRVFTTTSAIHIPEGWGDFSKRKLDFTKSPSGKKHFY